MKLRQLLDRYEGIYSDKQIILQWFTQNNKEDEGLEMITALSQARVNKVEKELDYIKTWLPTKVSMKDICKDMRVGTYLDKIITCQICNFELSDDLLEWAKENIPQMSMPKLFFMDTAKWLKDKYGIEFKE